MDKPNKLILDYSKWRCGGDGENKLGAGDQRLLNSDGFMCAEGQWHMQSGATRDQLLCNTPASEALDPYPFSIGAIHINDDEDTSPEDKIVLLTELLAKEGIELEVINKP